MPSNKNQLYYGDNLQVLRQYIPDQSVDLIYLDPPFNSCQDYNILLPEKTAHALSASNAPSTSATSLSNQLPAIAKLQPPT